MIEGLRLRRMTSGDLPAVMALQGEAFTNPWTEEMVKKELGHAWSTVLLAEAPGDGEWSLLGFAVFWLVADELHLLNIAASGAHRRRGVGRSLLQAVLASGQAHRCRLATLEVRRGNAAARSLYGSHGFREVGMRPAYYSDNREDAVVMLYDFPEAGTA